mmetsp:Transcript_28678/g.39613  ORF Transcript_28678/g.39613 Transcript_28678/m.39613 type:complete len:234 (-) Transcript_28678:233-934(-)|eukprot:CAMPEP_0196595072 /NCGR_PEP_ID=MMETSP1081-20130531/80080_1 /TAXON_ID=36882 /ORGANISM="Pyramimonas amylifera, Strain CCMP720" /LENGTH=233 /DNA_ID=CAMNT_0041919521 /DNA_START=270 /DNA_END=971 /DNA_ORIENTATION=+
MRRIFGAKKEKAPAPTLADASASLDSRGEGIDEKIKKLDNELVKHREAIKKMRPGPGQNAAKQRALRVLKQKKIYESQRENLYNQQFNVDQTAFTMENMKDTATTVQAMKAASKQLKTAFKSPDLDVDSIYDMQDDMADLMDQSNEINEALAQNYAVPDDLDEADLMDELEGLEADLAAEAETGAVPSYLQEDLPDVPSTTVDNLPQPNPAAPQSYPAIQTDEFGLPVAPQQN